MNVYIYQAALHCEKCIHQIVADLATPEDVGDEGSFDSDDYPKGPFPDSGGEADSPQHCDSCGLFLENALTDDGIAYVKEAIAETLRSGRDGVVSTWRAFYQLGDGGES
jgi:hypothetical protein